MSRFLGAVAATVLVIVATVIGYLSVEAVYRGWMYYSIGHGLANAANAQFPRSDGGTSIFDSKTGYRYRPNMTVERRDGPFPIFWRTNSHGHIARGDYPIAKPPREFRIGLVGDSMTGNVTNTVRWGDVLEDALNASQEWRDAIHKENTRVINFGLDGIGVVQFDDVVDELVVPFDVDLLIVNVIRPDVARRPYFRGNSMSVSPEQLARWVRERSIEKMDWFSAKPEVIALLAGRWIGLRPQLTFANAVALLNGERHYELPSEAADQSAEAAEAIIRRFPETIWLIHPIYQDYVGYDDPSDREAALFRESFLQFVARVPQIKWIQMIENLPKPGSREEIDSWYNVPADQHNSDKGLRIYGETVAAR